MQYKYRPEFFSSLEQSFVIGTAFLQKLLMQERWRINYYFVASVGDRTVHHIHKASSLICSVGLRQAQRTASLVTSQQAFHCLLFHVSSSFSSSSTSSFSTFFFPFSLYLILTLSTFYSSNSFHFYSSKYLYSSSSLLNPFSCWW